MEQICDGNCFSVASVVVRTPQKTLTGHNNAVTAAEWLSGGTQTVTASWDRTARVWDSESGAIIHTLTGKNSLLNVGRSFQILHYLLNTE